MIREIVSLVCEGCKRKNYTTTKNRRAKPEKMALRKYCPFCGKHLVHKEGKV